MCCPQFAHFQEHSSDCQRSTASRGADSRYGTRLEGPTSNRLSNQYDHTHINTYTRNQRVTRCPEDQTGLSLVAYSPQQHAPGAPLDDRFDQCGRGLVLVLAKCHVRFTIDALPLIRVPEDAAPTSEPGGHRGSRYLMSRIHGKRS